MRNRPEVAGAMEVEEAVVGRTSSAMACRIGRPRSRTMSVGASGQEKGVSLTGSYMMSAGPVGGTEHWRRAKRRREVKGFGGGGDMVCAAETHAQKVPLSAN